MPKKGSRLTPEQIGVLRAWLDQGAEWDPHVTFARLPPANLKPRLPEIPPGPKNDNRSTVSAAVLASHNFKPPPPSTTRVFARRAFSTSSVSFPSEDPRSFVSSKRSINVNCSSGSCSQIIGLRHRWLGFWNDFFATTIKALAISTAAASKLPPGSTRRSNQHAFQSVRRATH